jgi:hypothetical protein
MKLIFKGPGPKFGEIFSILEKFKKLWKVL